MHNKRHRGQYESVIDAELMLSDIRLILVRSGVAIAQGRTHDMNISLGKFDNRNAYYRLPDFEPLPSAINVMVAVQLSHE